MYYTNVTVTEVGRKRDQSVTSPEQLYVHILDYAIIRLKGKILRKLAS